MPAYQNPEPEEEEAEGMPAPLHVNLLYELVGNGKAEDKSEMSSQPSAYSVSVFNGGRGIMEPMRPTSLGNETDQKNTIQRRQQGGIGELQSGTPAPPAQNHSRLQKEFMDLMNRLSFENAVLPTQRPDNLERESSDVLDEVVHSAGVDPIALSAPGAQQHKRRSHPRQYKEIKRPYKCGWDGCKKAYSQSSHLNFHITKQAHGQTRGAGGTFSVNNQRGKYSAPLTL